MESHCGRIIYRYIYIAWSQSASAPYPDPQRGLAELWLKKKTNQNNNNNNKTCGIGRCLSPAAGIPTSSSSRCRFKTLGALSHLQVSSSPTKTLGIIGLAMGQTQRSRVERRRTLALLGKQAFPLPVELTAPLHAGPLPGPGVACWAEKRS